MSLTKSANIALLDAFHSGSHQNWSENFKKYSKHHVRLFTLPGRHWKWRMHGSAITLASQLIESNFKADIILATDMLDMSTLISLTRTHFPQTAYYTYFHENQLAYPWSPTDPDKNLQRDVHYSFINYKSALASQKIFFNSHYHRQIFLEQCEKMLRQFPDHNNLWTIERIQAKSFVLPLGLELQRLDAYQKESRVNKSPVILWNHRWEYDKNPSDFFEALFRLNDENVDFSLVVTGESYSKKPAIFAEAKKILSDKIIHFGYAENKDQYYQLLKQCDFLPVTSHQDFFGGSIVEAIYMGLIPLIPRRLAYPEHIPTELSPHFIYDHDEDFYPRLKKMLTNPDKYMPFRAALKQHVTKYDWQKIVGEYDLRMGK